MPLAQAAADAHLGKNPDDGGLTTTAAAAATDVDVDVGQCCLGTGYLSGSDLVNLRHVRTRHDCSLPQCMQFPQTKFELLGESFRFR